MTNHEREQLFDLLLTLMAHSKTIHTCLQELHGFALRTTEPEVLDIIVTMARANNQIHRLCKAVTSDMTSADIRREICRILGDDKE